MGTLHQGTWIPRDTKTTSRHQTGGVYHCFLPTRLADLDYALDADVVSDVARAERDLVSISTTDSASYESVTHLLLRLEAIASSSIEGIVVDATRLLRAEVQGPKHASKLIDHEAAAILGNVHALERAVELATGSAEMTPDILKDLHGVLCKGTQLEEWGGVIRSSQSWIGGILSTPVTASYVPPAPQEVPALLDDLCAFANRDDMSPVVLAALCHTQFEAIHPFADGNGRTGRALIQLCLIRRGVIGHTVLPISLALAHKREDYVDALNRYQHATDVQAEHDAINDWVSCFCGAVTTACTKVREIQQNLKLVRQGWRGQLDHVRVGSSLELMINAIEGTPIFTVETMMRMTGRSKQAVNLAVQRLLTTGIVRQANTGKRSRVFEAPDVLQELEKVEQWLVIGER